MSLSKRLSQIQNRTRDEHDAAESSAVDEFANASPNCFVENKNLPSRDFVQKNHDGHPTRFLPNDATLNVALKKLDLHARKDNFKNRAVKEFSNTSDCRYNMKNCANTSHSCANSSDFEICQRGRLSWESKKVEYALSEENRLAELVKETYSCDSVNAFLDLCFSKKATLRAPVSLLSRRISAGENDIYTSLKWSEDKLRELQNLKRKLNSVKDKLSEFDLNKWHKHTKSTNPADLVMRRLRSDVKVEFLTQAWCKFYEIVHRLKLIPRSVRQQNKLYTIHLCEAPGAFVASLNHYLKLHHPKIEWYWKANSLNPYYEGNHLSDMINDDRFMLQTIGNWDFGPDLTGDITHPDYPDYLRRQCGDHLPHLVTADGSFDCQDRPEEQENSVAWLHLKETLTALRVLRRGEPCSFQTY